MYPELFARMRKEETSPLLHDQTSLKAKFGKSAVRSQEFGETGTGRTDENVRCQYRNQGQGYTST